MHQSLVAAVVNERRRISQDLHDGVGSQLVSVLAVLRGLDQRDDQIIWMVERSLIELKTTVDALDGDDDNLIEALGSLRHRFHHLFEAMEISFAWNVRECQKLAGVKGENVLHILKVAQESLTNILSHSNATSIGLTCAVDDQRNSLVLEVRDDGTGFRLAERENDFGKGMRGMQRRAQALRAALTVRTKVGMGTTVRLEMPL
ncbi:MAG: ATP-binding protein [Pseudomonadota bacterium]